MSHLLHLRPRHYALLGAFFGAVAVQANGLHSWSEVFSPMFIFGALGQFAVLLTALGTEPPRKRSKFGKVSKTLDKIAGSIR